MGSGKSTLGKLLASQAFFSCDFVDLDEVIVERAGKKIPEIFAEHGEAYFRELESECLADMLQSDITLVIATGGGAILAENNRVVMKEKSRVIWLDASPQELSRRISGDSNRPLLHDVDPLEKMMALTAQRNPLYAEIAELKIDTETMTDQEAVAKIMAFLSE